MTYHIADDCTTREVDAPTFQRLVDGKVIERCPRCSMAAIAEVVGHPVREKPGDLTLALLVFGFGVSCAVAGAVFALAFYACGPGPWWFPL